MMSDDYIQIMLDEDGTAREYDGTYDFFVHCRSKEEQEEALTILSTMHWIPVSERLPEKDDRYLITTFGIFKREYVEMAGFSTASKTWKQYDLEYGYVPVDDVIAWMPLPEPYRKGEQE